MLCFQFARAGLSLFPFSYFVVMTLLWIFQGSPLFIRLPDAASFTLRSSIRFAYVWPVEPEVLHFSPLLVLFTLIFRGIRIRVHLSSDSAYLLHLCYFAPLLSFVPGPQLSRHAINQFPSLLSVITFSKKLRYDQCTSSNDVSLHRLFFL
jgi:hypothetical protein